MHAEQVPHAEGRQCSPGDNPSNLPGLAVLSLPLLHGHLPLSHTVPGTVGLTSCAGKHPRKISTSWR